MIYNDLPKSVSIEEIPLPIEDKMQLLIDVLEAIKDSSAPTFELQLKIIDKIDTLVDEL